MVFKGDSCQLAKKHGADFFGALIMTALVAFAAWFFGGFYYDLNDDVLIKDILSGVYTGRPEGHTMQILYPLGLLLSILYYIPGLPVFGLFLCLCQFGSIFVIAYRMLLCLDGVGRKTAALAAQLLFWLGVCLEQLVFLQYTVTAGMLGAAAIFWMATSGQERTLRGFLKENRMALILYWICFCLRSEMGLLLLPLAGVTGLCKWFSEKKPFASVNWTRYLGLFGVLMAGIVLLCGIEKLAYAGDDWQKFSRYFDARTTVYDYQLDVVDHYEENIEIYDALEMSKTRQQLLENYNFGADDKIDEVFMEQLAQLAQKRENGGLFRKDFRTALWELVFGHFFSGTDFGLNIAVIMMGAVLFVLGCFRKKKDHFWVAPVITACGCALWMILLLRGRMPDRIAVPLYLAMLAAFGGLFFAQGKTTEDNETEEWNNCLQNWANSAIVIGFVLIGILTLPGEAADVEKQIDVREETNLVNEAVLDYCSRYEDILFLEDVYSTVSFSEKIGVDRNKPFNYDLLGGWLVKSPLTDKKLEAFQLASMGAAVRQNEQVRLLVKADSNFVWLTEFLAEEGITAEAVLVETIADGAVDVYRIVEK